MIFKLLIDSMGLSTTFKKLDFVDNTNWNARKLYQLRV